MNLKKVVPALLSVAAFFSPGVRSATVSMVEDGVRIEGGSLGTFTLSYPVLIGEKNQEFKAIEKTAANPKATLKYAGGAQAVLTAAENGELTIAFSNLAAGTQRFKTDVLIPFDFSHGGKWNIDGKEQAFPEQKPAKPHLFQGNGKSVQIINAENRSLSITVPEFSYLQISDNREWNWKTFAWSAFVPVQGNAPEVHFRIVVGTAEGGIKKIVLVDEFGQDFKGEWPDKVTKLEELKGDVDNEKKYYAGFPVPRLDAYGGLLASGEKLGLRKTGFFHVEKKVERWHLVDPDGNVFFHMGVCSFGVAEDYTYVKGRQPAYAWLPPYDGEFHAAWHPEPFWSHDSFSFYLANVIRKYGNADPDALARRMIERVRAFGFNSGGAFSGIPKAVPEKAKFPYVGSLPIGPWGEFKIEMLPGLRETFDPFDEKTRINMDKSFAQTLPRAADDPLLIGYFLTNEPAHEDLPKVIPTLKANVAAKRRLVEMLQAKYKTIDAFSKAWSVTADSFEKLNDTGLAVKTPAASADMKEYEALFFEASHKLIRETFDKYDKNHLLIGDRWQPQTADNEQLCRIVGKYCDVVSVNYYTYGVNLNYLKNIYKWSGERPMFLSEFHWCSPKDSGLPGGKEVASQQERGLAYRNYVEQSAALGFVTGIEWFTLLDQARTGRFFERYAGENSNCGLFNVVDRPWKPMVEEMAKTNHTIYEVLSQEHPPFRYDNPRFR